MNEHDKHITEDKLKKEVKEMCDSCIHKYYCAAVYKKDHWCGNHMDIKNVTNLYVL